MGTRFEFFTTLERCRFDGTSLALVPRFDAVLTPLPGVFSNKEDLVVVNAEEEVFNVLHSTVEDIDLLEFWTTADCVAVVLLVRLC